MTKKTMLVLKLLKTFWNFLKNDKKYVKALNPQIPEDKIKGLMFKEYSKLILDKKLKWVFFNIYSGKVVTNSRVLLQNFQKQGLVI